MTDLHQNRFCNVNLQLLFTFYRVLSVMRRGDARTWFKCGGELQRNKTRCLAIK